MTRSPRRLAPARWLAVSLAAMASAGGCSSLRPGDDRAPIPTSEAGAPEDAGDDAGPRATDGASDSTSDGD